MIAAAILLLFFIWLLLGRRAAGNADLNEYPYEHRPLLTPNEERFYQALRPIAERYGLHILSNGPAGRFCWRAARLGKKMSTAAISAKFRPSMWISCWPIRSVGTGAAHRGR